MKKSKALLAVVSILILCIMTVNLSSCGAKIHAKDLMDGVTPRSVEKSENLSQSSQDVTDFAIRLFKEANENGENTLISPLSVLCALAMTANGAEGETLTQMESVLGMSVEELNLYLYTYVNSLPEGEKYKLSLANSIWFTDDTRFNVNRDFLQANADYYGADVYKAPFNKQTMRDINNWVKNETDGMIPKVLDEIPEEAIMYLINALAFEAEWNEIYEKNQVRDRIFTKENGEEQEVKLMYSTEGRYLEDENATGFIKYYKGSEYAFVALLPNEGTTVAEYLDTLNGTSLNALLSGAERRTVETAMPKFETEFETEMSDILISMDMPNAFDPELSDFDGVGTWQDGSIYIGNVIHKTHIEVGEKGTKAGAITSIQLDGATSAGPIEVKTVYLDRPFVYMLIDCENNIPFFIGTMMDVNG
ncbi:MAG: serpin family protein [Clostridia bacterium]|nr:serpin family protein [Clostridia bacterium]